jgi:hypothetical protein
MVKAHKQWLRACMSAAKPYIIGQPALSAAVALRVFLNAWRMRNAVVVRASFLALLIH